MRVIIGLVKGLIVGGAVGYGLLRLGWTSGALAYVACAIVGALVGVVAGRAPWKAETIWTPVLKMIVGAGIGVGLAALGTHFGPDSEVYVRPLQTGLEHVPFRSGPILAPIIGVLYGVFVEWDDGGGKKDAAAAKKGDGDAPPAPKKRA
ncbi:MAG TPA: hypothetical protein VHB97_08705 [Polyangia bacterium]|jgi:hypothetical protein|nr:hypothetical protein [Polyangia bacterium]